MVHKIKEIAKSKNLTIAKVERMSNVTERTIQRWDKQEPSVFKVYRVAQTLGTTVEELIEGDV